MSSYPKTAGDELRFALAGPGVTLAIASLFAMLIALALPASTPQAVTAVVAYQFFVNVAILGFNLLPAFPLDGERVARALIWRQPKTSFGPLRSLPRSAAASATG